MPVSESLAYHVHGPCYVMVSTGVSNAYENLGMTKDGARVREEFKRRPVFSDAAGPEAPVDFQIMGEEVTVDLTLMSWSEGVLQRALAKSRGSTVESGLSAPPGTFLHANGHSFGLYLPSAGDAPWWCPTITIRQPSEQSVGTVANERKLTFYGFRAVAANELTSAGKVLVRRVAPT